MRSILSCRRLAGRAAVVAAALLGASLSLPQAAYADTAEPALTASVAFAAGESAEAPVASASVALPDGDVVLGGTFSQTTSFDGTVLEPVTPGRPTGFVARYSADGTHVRWVRDLAVSMRPVAVVPTAGAVAVTTSSLAPTSTNFSSWAFGLDLDDGSFAWSDGQQDSHAYCLPPDMAAGPDGSVVIVGAIVSGPYQDRCVVVLRSLDAATGAERWSRVIESPGNLWPAQLAVGDDGRVFLGGHFQGTVTLGNRQLVSPQGCATEFVAGFGPDGSQLWARTSDAACSGYPTTDDLIATSDAVYAWAQRPLTPQQGTSHALVALDPATGADRWQAGIPIGRTPFEYPEAGALAKGPDGTVVLAAPFAGSVQVAPGMWLDSSAGQDQQDVAVLGVSGSDGRVLYAQRIGGGAEDRAWSLAVEGRELVVAGLFDIDRRDVAPATRVAYARTDLPVVDPGVPPPVAPVVQWSPGALTYPAAVGAEQLNARFVDSYGTPVSGSTTYSVQVGQVLPAGMHALVATFHSSQAGFTDVTVERSLLVDRAVPQLSWPGASSLVYGQPLPPAAVASGNAGPVSGHLSYPSGAAPGSVLDAGSHALRLAFDSTDPNYASTSSTFSITVTKAASHIDARSLTLKRQLTATLRDTSNDVALAYKPVVFYFSNKTCTAYTDASGTATCSLAPGEALTVLRLGFTAVFDGDTNHERAGVQVAA